ncbi:hypothetical protein VB774_03765 [Pseudanabaena galeata UHCC 0370]|uniref:Uncharacterized protein n=1 Tax=Pseudanabaena galeata UHCC 0370 TaxID=3110310 RepID=A0ABU5TEP3_9CYAN|nr:hypothetical protein [Pseudanabaena galeata]MEA5476729.1 hypothetical protein [Pseudanabaena galeata UHCC 0370]
MQKIILSCFFSAISITIASTTSVTAAKAQPMMGEYLDSTTPQVIEKISGNIVTFKNSAGESNNYFVPNWMMDKYALKVGTSASLYNRNIVQGIYRDRYIDVISQGLLLNMSAFSIHETERNCTTLQSPASEGLTSGKRVWYKTDSCPSAIPIVGSMSLYQPRAVTSSTEGELEETTITDPSAPAMSN